MSSIIRRCEYCHKSIEHRKASAKTCGNTCRQYASEVRQGKRDPVPFPESDQEINETKIPQEELERQLSILENKFIESDKALKELRESWGEGFSDELDELILNRFRALEARNDYLKKYFFKSDEISGDNIHLYNNTLTRYPFNKLNHVLFEKLGNPVQPFLSVIVGPKDTGKSILSVLISNSLTSRLSSKVLHIVDFENKDKVLEYYSSEKSTTNLLLVKVVESVNDIEKALRKDDFEFVIIDSITGLKLNYNHIRQIQKQHPKLSIFCTLKRELKQIVEVASITFKTEAFSNQFGYSGGFAKVYKNGINQQYEHCDIFYNGTHGFVISL